MTVQSTTSRADYNCNGVTTAFNVPFYFLDNSHLMVLLTDTGTGAVTTLALGTNYTVSGAGNPAGGSITTTTAYASTKRLSILRDVPLTQLTAYPTNGPFPAASHETALDKLTMLVQQHGETLDRALTLAPNSNGVTAELPSAVANRVIAWNGDATGLTNASLTELSTTILGANTIVDTFSGDGTTVAFTLAAAPGSKNNTIVTIGGIYQQKSEYSISGTTITFTAAPPIGTSNIEVLQQVAVNYPVTSISPNTVETATLVDGAVTTDKLANNAVTSGKIADGAVATADIADGAVTLAKLNSAAYGTSGANKLLQLDSSGKLPAVDASQLTNVPVTGLTLAALPAALAGLGVGAIGTYAFLGETTTTQTAPGSTRPGSALRYTGYYASGTHNSASIALASATGAVTAPNTPSGTWMAMGVSAGLSYYGATLWQRIA